MNYYLIAPAKTFHNSDSLLTYESEQKLEIGQIVTIPLGKQSALGVVMQRCDKPEFETKPISGVLYEKPLPLKLTKALSWLADYYRAPFRPPSLAASPRNVDIKPKNCQKSKKSTKIPLIPLKNAPFQKLNPATLALFYSMVLLVQVKPMSISSLPKTASSKANPLSCSFQKSLSLLSSYAIFAPTSTIFFCFIPSSANRYAIRFGRKSLIPKSPALLLARARHFLPQFIILA